MSLVYPMTWTGELSPRDLVIALSLVLTTFCFVAAADGFRQYHVPFPGRKDYFSILYQQYKFVVDGPGIIKKGYEQFTNGLFEIPRTFRFGQVILCQQDLIEELKNKRTPSNLACYAWILPPEMGWPKIAKTTPGVIRNTVHKKLHRYMPSMNQAILAQLKTLDFKNGECNVGCFDLAYSIVARSGSFSMVGSRLSQDDEYLEAIKNHILGMIVTTRVQFLLPDWLKQYIGGITGRLATLGTGWDMHASRKILLKHFNARAEEYHAEIFSKDDPARESKLEETEAPEEIFRWLYEGCVLRGKWKYTEVIGEMLLLQFAFIYTTSYGLYGALAELARRPEYIQPLREEINTVFSKEGPTVAACDGMVMMDSFLKECQRLHPPSALSAHRVCISDLALSNGITLKRGSHVAVPSGIIQQSSEHYVNPESFDGFRFVKRAAAGAKDSRLVDLSPDYLVFGMGAHACPGRWMASALMKLSFAHILSSYDILLPNSSTGPLTGSLSFEEFYVPNFGLKITLRHRE
ncbi:Cytochrome P450 [Penicillium bovifimosum]|uniref:Cytochrome P450 n=1 Tax=Penicillium bovifimosum TaxID=126998 RepID=A0A9W9GUN9_9EURO|nr:Cytochrome P450 [Penicillium bovifimosum]KAJ5130342.1 Cytochrome P450 [Penicillium bovifimosum]